MGRKQRNGPLAAGIRGLVVPRRGAPRLHVLPLAMALAVVHRRDPLLAHRTAGFTAGAHPSRPDWWSWIPGAGAIGLQSDHPGPVGGDCVALGASDPVPPGRRRRSQAPAWRVRGGLAGDLPRALPAVLPPPAAAEAPESPRLWRAGGRTRLAGAKALDSGGAGGG